MNNLGIIPGRATEAARNTQLALKALGAYKGPTEGLCTPSFLLALHQFKLDNGLGDDFELDTSTAFVLRAVNSQRKKILDTAIDPVETLTDTVRENIAYLGQRILYRGLCAERVVLEDYKREFIRYLHDLETHIVEFPKTVELHQASLNSQIEKPALSAHDDSDWFLESHSLFAPGIREFFSSSAPFKMGDIGAEINSRTEELLSTGSGEDEIYPDINSIADANKELSRENASFQANGFTDVVRKCGLYEDKMYDLFQRISELFEEQSDMKRFLAVIQDHISESDVISDDGTFANTPPAIVVEGALLPFSEMPNKIIELQARITANKQRIASLSKINSQSTLTSLREVIAEIS